MGCIIRFDFYHCHSDCVIFTRSNLRSTMQDHCAQIPEERQHQAAITKGIRNIPLLRNVEIPEEWQLLVAITKGTIAIAITFHLSNPQLPPSKHHAGAWSGDEVPSEVWYPRSEVASRRNSRERIPETPEKRMRQASFISGADTITKETVPNKQLKISLYRPPKLIPSLPRI